MLHVPTGTPMNTIIAQLTSVASELMLTYHEMNRTMKNDVQRSLNQMMLSCMCNGRHSHVLKEMLNSLIDPVLVQTTTQSVAGDENGGGNTNQRIPRYHPVTGLPETRLAFEYVDLWLSLTRTSDVLTSAKMGHLKVPPKEHKKPKAPKAQTHGSDGNDEEEDNEDDQDIMDAASNRADADLVRGAEDTATVVFDTLMARCLHLVARLRLGEIQEVDSTDGSLTLRPRNVVDMDMFLNLCTFLAQLLPKYYEAQDQNRFVRWLPTLCDRVVAVAIRPECHNVSGFYRLLTLAIRSGERSGSFGAPGEAGTVRCREILRPFLVGIHQRVSARCGSCLWWLMVYL